MPCLPSGETWDFPLGDGESLKNLRTGIEVRGVM